MSSKVASRKPYLPIQRNDVSADRAYAVVDECEPMGGGVASATTIFLTASECPVGCSMCDLWQNTLTGPTPDGAIVQQIDHALSSREPTDWIKLYNSGNFFDARSIPPVDYRAIADRCNAFQRVVVENHPKFGKSRLLQFRDLLSGTLEVAVGLETVQPRWLARMNKNVTRDEFDQYGAWLKSHEVELRVFLIVGVPGISAAEAIRWARLSVRHACRAGARHISLIPARSGHGWNGQAHLLPEISPQQLESLQCDSITDVDSQSVVCVDLWDIDAGGHEEVVERISARNLSQVI